MIAAAGAIYGVASSSAFDVADVSLSGVRYSDETAIRARLELPDGSNLFRVATEPLEARLRELPTVADASVSARLPGTLAVEVTERVPVLVWRSGDDAFLVDAAGVLFAKLANRPAADAASLPVVDDQRTATAATALVVGASLDPIDRDAATRLGSLSPADVGSASTGLSIEVTDVHGFVLRAQPRGWQAVFGFYTLSLRSPEMIPGQVRLLRSLLLEHGERNVSRIVLASEERGTFTTPRPSASP